MTKEKKPLPLLFFQMGLIALLFYLFFSYLTAHYRIGIDSQLVRCFPDSKYFVVTLSDDVTKITRNNVIAYEAKGLGPFFKDGTLMAKIVSGVPGDHLRIDKKGIFINDQLVAKGFAHAARLGMDESSFFKDEIIPEGKYFLTAPAPESYDSRYWGYMNESQFVGSAQSFL